MIKEHEIANIGIGKLNGNTFNIQRRFICMEEQLISGWRLIPLW